MADDALLAGALAAIRAAWEEGCPVAGHAEALAPVLVRRWRSAGRRGVRLEDNDERVDDLTRGMRSGTSNPTRGWSARCGPTTATWARKVADRLRNPGTSEPGR